MGLESHRRLIHRYYDEIWNRWGLDGAAELISPSIRFRGSLGVSVEGLEGFLSYVRAVREAFPDFRNTVEDLIAEEDRVAARLLYSGTHLGPAFGMPPTGRSFAYAGAAFFRIAGGKIAEGWVLGDVDGLRAQLKDPEQPGSAPPGAP